MPLPYIEEVAAKIAALPDVAHRRVCMRALRDSMLIPDEHDLPLSLEELLARHEVSGERLQDLGVVVTKPRVLRLLTESGLTLSQPTVNAIYTAPRYQATFRRPLQRIRNFNTISIGECFYWFGERRDLEFPHAMMAYLED
jgi:hypothetical protein